MPSATLMATPSTIESGQSARLDWTSADATSVTLNGAAVPASGSQMVSPGASTTYTLTATNATGATTATATVTVTAPPPPPMRITYVTHIQPIMQQNCVQCHSGPNPTAGRDFTTYAGVMTTVTPGDPNSLLIRRTQPGGAMHGFLSPDPIGRAETIRQWIVDFMAAEQ
jgi:mono/diheme cytochrome c family protein